VILAIHPVLPGEGIPILPQIGAATELKLQHVTPYDTGLVTLHYTVGRVSKQAQ
jgi:hypothetical protein